MPDGTCLRLSAFQSGIRCGISALALGACAAPMAAQTVPDTMALQRALATPTSNQLDAHIRFLADDLLEGRAPGSRGADIAAHYIRAQFEEAGLAPGAPDGTFFQRIQLVGLTSSPSLVVGVAQRTTALKYLDDFVAWPHGPEAAVIADGELVFVGYGIEATEWTWDDFKMQPLAGKVLLMLVNDPGLEDPSVFNGPEITNYGLWTYKIEQAARLGAVGVILIHTDRSATYPWTVVRNSWSGEQVRVEAESPQMLRFGAWVTEQAARQIVRGAGIGYDLMMRRAARRDFRPIPMNAHVIVDISSRIRRFESVNVIGRLETDAAGEEQAVVLTAHYDHHGIGQPIGEDSIYNGALDNASGVAVLIASATALAQAGPTPIRSIYFAATTAEEAGLLGAEALVRSPPVPLAQTAAVVNIDRANLWGGTRDLVMLGAEKSSLLAMAEEVARADGLRLAPDPSPESGRFYRSDHFPFARAGVPVLSLVPGLDFADRPPDWGRDQYTSYMSNRYHQPSDEYRPDFNYDGLLQQVSAMIRLAWRLAETPELPAWNEDSKFRAAADRLRNR